MLGKSFKIQCTGVLSTSGQGKWIYNSGLFGCSAAPLTSSRQLAIPSGFVSWFRTATLQPGGPGGRRDEETVEERDDGVPWKPLMFEKKTPRSTGAEKIWFGMDALNWDPANYRNLWWMPYYYSDHLLQTDFLLSLRHFTPSLENGRRYPNSAEKMIANRIITLCLLM